MQKCAKSGTDEFKEGYQSIPVLFSPNVDSRAMILLQFLLFLARKSVEKSKVPYPPNPHNSDQTAQQTPSEWVSE